jgi:hypothetical protein
MQAKALYSRPMELAEHVELDQANIFWHGNESYLRFVYHSLMRPDQCVGTVTESQKYGKSSKNTRTQSKAIPSKCLNRARSTSCYSVHMPGVLHIIHSWYENRFY